jgi:hypothetical protein
LYMGLQANNGFVLSFGGCRYRHGSPQIAPVLIMTRLVA